MKFGVFLNIILVFLFILIFFNGIWGFLFMNFVFSFLMKFKFGVFFFKFEFRYWNWREMQQGIIRRIGLFRDICFWLWGMTRSLGSFWLVWRLPTVAFFRVFIRFCCQRRRLQRKLQNRQWKRGSRRRRLRVVRFMFCVVKEQGYSLVMVLMVFCMMWWIKSKLLFFEIKWNEMAISSLFLVDLKWSLYFRKSKLWWLFGLMLLAIIKTKGECGSSWCTSL